MSQRWLHWPAAAAGGGTDYTDYMIAGTSYWIIPDGTTTSEVAKTGGDTSVGWATMWQVNASGSPTITTVSGSVTMDSIFNRVIQGGYNQLPSVPYQYCASYRDGDGGFGQVQAPGWIISESEAVPGTYANFRHTFVPIEVQDGVVGAGITSAGYAPGWSKTGFEDSLVFFFNSYTPGDVQGWTAWNGTTTP